MTIVFAAITGVHAAAAWAADGGADVADAADDAGPDAGQVVDDTCGSQKSGRNGAGPNAAVLFGAGCC